MASEQITEETTLLHLKYVSDVLARQPADEGTMTGASLLVRTKTLADGRRAVTASVSERVHARRASGKIYRRWSPVYALSVRRTKQDLVVARQFSHSDRRVSVRHLFSAEGVDQELRFITDHFRQLMLDTGRHTAYGPRRDDERVLRPLEGPTLGEIHEFRGTEIGRLDRLIADAGAAARARIGEIAAFTERFPLLAERFANAPAATYMPYLDAQNPARVAKNLFGRSRYRRPLGRQVAALGPGPHLGHV